jgi:asparagine synthase (glutamine-hydrolysing)
VAELLTLTYVPAPRTPIAGIHKLDAGTVLTWRSGRADLRRWWRWPRPTSASDASPVQLEQRMRDLIVDAVRLQLRSDVPVGVLLSGGIDSTAVLWACRELGVAVPGFCVDFAEHDGDTGFARLAGQRLRAEVRERPLRAPDAGTDLPAMVGRLSEPLGDPAVLPSLRICRAAGGTVRVLLSGTGADELWGGYGRYVLPGADHREVYVRELSVLPEPEVRAALGLSSRTAPVTERLAALLAEGRSAGGDVAAARMHLDGSLSLPGDLLPLLDMTSMAVSLEARVPLLDHRIVALAATLDGATRIPGGELKGFLRRSLRGRIPDEILDRPKRGFAPPLAEWMAGPLGRTAQWVVTMPGGIADNALDPTMIARWLDPTAATTALRALRLWLLLVTDLWWRDVLVEDSVTGTLEELVAAGRGRVRQRW